MLATRHPGEVTIRRAGAAPANEPAAGKATRWGRGRGRSCGGFEPSGGIGCLLISRGKRLRGCRRRCCTGRERIGCGCGLLSRRRRRAKRLAELIKRTAGETGDQTGDLAKRLRDRIDESGDEALRIELRQATRKCRGDLGAERLDLHLSLLET